jgi:hypothetical protein
MQRAKKAIPFLVYMYAKQETLIIGAEEAYE